MSLPGLTVSTPSTFEEQSVVPVDSVIVVLMGLSFSPDPAFPSLPVDCGGMSRLASKNFARLISLNNSLSFLSKGRFSASVFRSIRYFSELWKVAEIRAGSFTSIRAISTFVGSRLEPIARRKKLASCPKSTKSKMSL